MDVLQTIPISTWQNLFSEAECKDMTHALENGQVLFFPKLAFQLGADEQHIFSPQYVSAKSKNISYNPLTSEVRGMAAHVSKEQSQLMHDFLGRFANQAKEFVNNLFPHYTKSLTIGRTSFRPVEIKGRVSSYRKDDTRLHVDAFPASPNQGWRILRVFCNVNPNGQSRVWRLGEPFADVAQQFLARLQKPIPGSSTLLHLLKITKKRRTLYDHFMLQLHDNMKADEVYQQKAKQLEFHFPSCSTWVVQTDHVSHAAMSGQYLLEQTFYLPVFAMLDENRSPLRVLENLIQRQLV